MTIGVHVPSTTRGRIRLVKKKNPHASDTISAPQNTPGNDSPVPGTPNAPRMSMSFAMKKASGSAKNSSISQIWISCGIRDPILSNASTPRQMNRSTRMGGKNNVCRQPTGKREQASSANGQCEYRM